MQLNKSRARFASQVHLYWQIAYKCALRENFLLFYEFSFLVRCFFWFEVREENCFSLVTANFLFFLFPFFPILSSARFSFSRALLLDVVLCWSSFRSILSQLFFSFHIVFHVFFLFERIFSFPLLILVLLKAALTNLYRMRGLTDFARTIPIGNWKKSYWKISIGWRLFFFPPLRLFHILSIGFRFFVVRLFGPVI